MARRARRMIGKSFVLILSFVLTAPLAAQLRPRGPETQVNSGDLRLHLGPALGLNADQGLLAAWSDSGLFVSNVLARTFDGSGEPEGVEAVVNTPGKLRLEPAVAALADGRFAVLWVNTESPLSSVGTVKLGEPGTLSGRIVDAAGAAVGAEFRVDTGNVTGPALVRATALADGGFLATWWEQVGRLMARFFAPDGEPRGPAIVLHSSSCAYSNLAVKGLADGGFLAVFRTYGFDAKPCGGGPSSSGLLGRRFDADGKPTGPAFPIDAASDGQVAIAADGRFAVAWSDFLNDPPLMPLGIRFDTSVRLFGPDGTPATSVLPVADGTGDQILEALAMNDAGEILVVWGNDWFDTDNGVDADLFGRAFTADGLPFGPSFPLAAKTAGDQYGATASAAGREWVVSWVSEPAGQLGGNLFVRRFSTCGSPSTLCLAGRFRVEADWRIPGTGQSGTGTVLPLTQDTGAFWFFSAENPELLVKVLDGSAINGHFWVFLGALSDVEYDVTVTDLETGAHRTYHNPQGTLASRADVDALPVPAGDKGLAAEAASRPRPVAAAPKLTPPPCFQSPENLCLGPFNIYKVEVDWAVPSTGASGSGQAVPLTGDAGTFWFFGPDNVELLVKILDGSAVNGHVWVFYASLTDVEFTLRVSDELRNPKQVRTYHNPAGRMASRADTEAF